ncbi:MAG: type II toxin-antitoxin system RelE/ParE family toxin [Deltaproteobacteria bacterium]|nr:type II toxin-antitoxin system RelE/ParE family toxin [Deltaproteobacteria bacterium]
MTYQVLLLPSAQRDVDDIRGKLFDRLKSAITILASNPRPRGSLKMTGEGGYRVRVGDYRILYRIDDALKKIFIYRIKHRREVYR